MCCSVLQCTVYLIRGSPFQCAHARAHPRAEKRPTSFEKSPISFEKSHISFEKSRELSIQRRTTLQLLSVRTRERIQEQKRALHLLKRAVYCQYRGGLPHSSFQFARARARRGASYHDRYKSHVSSQKSPTSSEKSPTSSEKSPTSSEMRRITLQLFSIRARESAPRGTSMRGP